MRVLWTWAAGAALVLLAACGQVPASGSAAVELDSAVLIDGQAPERPVSLPDAWEVTAPARDGRNVGEISKKDDCWKRLVDTWEARAR
jgi:ABC-type glycerol-3-phosphate transport system substrate-binding protein